MSHDRRVDELRMALGGGAVKELFVEPPTVPNPDRVPLTDAHRRGVLDPMTAGLMRVAGTGDTVSAEACRRTIPVFDGRMRFDLHLSFKRFEQVQSERGYQGPVAVCGVQFVPVAGYVPDRYAIRYLMAQREMEVWVAPVAGTRIVVPYRISLQTPLGLGRAGSNAIHHRANVPACDAGHCRGTLTAFLHNFVEFRPILSLDKLFQRATRRCPPL